MDVTLACPDTGHRRSSDACWTRSLGNRLHPSCEYSSR